MAQRDDAIALWQRAAHIDPNRIDIWLNLAIAMLTKGEGYQALAFARRAVGLNADSAEAQSQLGVALSAVGKHDEAQMAAPRR